jgi:2-keto-4-pentenoate hydratase/2-oxohepta-3-ene-1,7-dioic acid hydratase in catechol pathway
MRFITVSHAGRDVVGLLPAANATHYIDLSVAAPQLPATLAGILADANALQVARNALQVGGSTASGAPSSATSSAMRPLAGAHFRPLIPNPGKIICLGLNYADHAKEGGHARPEYPSFFLRGPSSMTGHLQPIVRPKASTKLDYEAELAVVIGKRARHLTAANALDCIAGYSCFNDGSIRDYQRKTTQWTIGKNFDATGPFGPWLVTPDELPPGCAGLRIQSRLNGQVMQDANTNDFLWDVKESLVILTECMTLEPGDVIITGTPAGVGYARTPPVFMQPGDTIEIEVEGIGVLRNSIADE